MPIQELSVHSTEELVAKVLSVGQEKGVDRTLWHRGHASSSYKLIPSLARSVTSTDELFQVERKLINRFRQRSLPYWPAGYPQNDWEHMFAMQHYGIPTRLLDWTENLFVALYFAAIENGQKRRAVDNETLPMVPAPPTNEVSEVPEPAAVPPNGAGSTTTAGDEVGTQVENPVIWTLDPAAWNRNSPHLRDFEVGILGTEADELRPYEPDNNRILKRHKTPLAIYGTHNSARIVAQRGTFTIAGNSTDPLDSFVQSGDSTLWKFVLDYPVEQIRRDLAVLGFAESMIFPDLAGLSKEIAMSEGLK